jgi:uncharacterized protein (TIGR00369 family)
MTEAQLSVEQRNRIEKALASVPYAELLGIELLQVQPGTATLGMKVRPELTQNNGVMHGGAIASLIDSATAFAIISLLNPEQKVTTADLTISYLRPVTQGQLRAVATVLRAGRRLFVVSANVSDGDQKLVSTALSTYITV